ncbi:MAG: hypothetical protein LRY27_04435 [Chitinophagales bacterium]|nr:hypothetical protein [Chitinophagales bacterium]
MKIIDRSTNIEFAKRFQKHCFVEGGNYTDYLYKFIEIDTVQLILSLRFVDSRVHLPFIDILYYSGTALDFTNKLPNILPQIKEFYKAYNLIGVRIESNLTDLDLFNPFIKEEDLYILAKPISLVQDDIANFDIKLEQLQHINETDYKIYEEEYKLFNQEFPLLNFVKSEPINYLQELCEDNFVFKIHYRNNYAGLLIFVKDFYDALYGYCVLEKIIFKKYRNLGIATQAQLLAESYIKNHAEDAKGFILGTISPLNKSSLQAAIKSGRKVVMKKVFLVC